MGLLAGLGVLALVGCGTPPRVLKVTSTGGDAHPLVKVSPTGQMDVAGVNIGDTVVFAPGSMRAVVRSPVVNIVLYEDGSITEAENKKALSINRREGAKIEVMKGRLLKGDYMQQSIAIDLNGRDPFRYDVELLLMAFNRGEKAFRGDLAVYDLLPPELQLLGTGKATKYNDRRSVKGALSAIPLVGLFSMGMDNFSNSGEEVEILAERLDNVSKYTFRRLVLEPGQAVGFNIRVRYTPPSTEELEDLRLESRPMTPGMAQ
jgi:hypothetical protein